MRRFLGGALGVALVLSLAAPAAAATPVIVPGSAGWVSTGLVVEGVDTLAVETLGFVTTAKIPDYHIPGYLISGSGPAGQTKGFLCGDVEPSVDPLTVGVCGVDEAYFGELIGRVGDVTFAIGSTRTITIPSGTPRGTLELAANDFSLTYYDNHGQFTVLFR